MKNKLFSFLILMMYFLCSYSFSSVPIPPFPNNIGLVIDDTYYSIGFAMNCTEQFNGDLSEFLLTGGSVNDLFIVFEKEATDVWGNVVPRSQVEERIHIVITEEWIQREDHSMINPFATFMHSHF